MGKLQGHTFNHSRRKFLKNSGWLSIGTTVLFSTGCSLIPAIPTTSDNLEESVDAWIQISPENRVRFFVAKAEMGQGILSGLSQIIAAEFNMSLKDVDPVFPHTNQISPVKMTVGSESIATLYPHIRLACGRLKQSLKTALSSRLGNSLEELDHAEGGIYDRRTERFFSYGDIVSNQAKIELLSEIPLLQNPQDQLLIGKRVPLLDTAPKTNGSAQYCHDVKLPDMLYGCTVKPPAFEATIESVDSHAAEQAKGVIRVVIKIEHGLVGIVATTKSQAISALEKLNVTWKIPKIWQQQDVDELLDIERLKSHGVAPDKLRDDVHPSTVVSEAAKTISLSYSTPFGAHAAMETHAGLAHVRGDRADLWVGSQDAFFHQKLASKITGLALEDINVHTTFIGGGFGGKVMVAAAVEAIHLSHAVQKPVQVIWSREENFQHGYFRTPSRHHIEAGLTAQGKVSFWKHEFSSGAVIFNSSAVPRLVHQMILFFSADSGASRGARIPYAFAHQEINQWDRIFPVPTGAWRGLSTSSNAFAIESTVDALARAAKIDPVVFRLNHLDNEYHRLKKVIQKVAGMTSWDVPMPEGKGRGIACGIYKETSFVAVVAEICLDKKNKKVKVEKLYCAHDCGLVINPNSVESLIEGNLIWGLGMALIEDLSVKDGKMNLSNFDQFQLPRMSDTPTIEIALLEDKSIPPAGAGEPAIMPTPAAIANAVFDASNKRVTSLPIRWNDLFDEH